MIYGVVKMEDQRQTWLKYGAFRFTR